MRQGLRKEYTRGTRRHRWSSRFPLDKFLYSRLGQKWSDVHKEMSAEFDRRTYSGYFFWKNFDRWADHIAVNCWIGAETGTVYNNGHRGEERVEGLYVHPFTDIICYQGPVPKKPSKPVETTRFVINDRIALEKIDGIWYQTEYKKEDPGNYNSYYNSPIYRNKEWVVLSKKQLSNATLRANNLTNNTPEEIVELLKEKERKIQEEKARMDALYPHF
jgi:hypothetical protein